jgi:hypothetical protein
MLPYFKGRAFPGKPHLKGRAKPSPRIKGKTQLQFLEKPVFSKKGSALRSAQEKMPARIFVIFAEHSPTMRQCLDFVSLPP